LADFMALPRNTQYTVGGLLALGVIAIAIMIAAGPTEPILVETALGTAAVQSAETPLLETEAASSPRLEVLQRGTELNVLGHVRDPGQRLVRVQVVTPRPRHPGFVALADLGHLSSGDPDVAWEFLGLGRSAADATPEAARAFSQALTEFSVRFPGTPQATVAALEQVQIHLRLAKEAKAAGRPRAEWQVDVNQARKAMDAAGIREPGSEEEKRLFATPADFTTWVYRTRTKQLFDPFQELRNIEETAVQTTRAGDADGPTNVVKSADVATLLQRTASAWHSGDLDSCETYAKQALTLAPDNSKAKAWLWQVREARKQ
jgi:hypothetical protein